VRPPLIRNIAFMIAGCLFVAGCSSAAPTATDPQGQVKTSGSATPTASADDATTFTSARYRYGLAMPRDWTVSETPGTGGVHPDEPGVDTFQDRFGHILSVVGESSVPALAGWTCAIARHLTGDHQLVADNEETVTIDGEPARLTSYHLAFSPYVTHYLTAEVVHAGRGLTLSLESTTGDDADDRALFDQVVTSFAFTG
jgi:hypothetical protein